jgi:hypothetical protein
MTEVVSTQKNILAQVLPMNSDEAQSLRNGALAFPWMRLDETNKVVHGDARGFIPADVYAD